jgi:leucine dehydrogenase
MVYAPDYITNAGGTIYDTDRLGVGGVSHERGRTKVSRIYENMLRVFEIADRDQIPTSLAADRMAEERIRQIAKVKKLGSKPEYQEETRILGTRFSM